MKIEIEIVQPILQPHSHAVPELDCRRLDDDYHLFFTVSEVNGLLSDFYNVTVDIKKDFLWDGMSIPKPAWSFVGSPFGSKHIVAGLVHDWLYKNHLVPRYVADLVMLEILKQQDNGWLSRKVMYGAVRTFGGKHYNKGGE